MLLRGRLGAPEGRDGGGDLGGDWGVLPGRRLGLMLHVLQLLQLETLLQLLLVDMLLELLLLQLHVVLKMLLLQLLLELLLLELLLLQLLLLQLLHLLLLLLLRLHWGAHLGGGCRAHHGADQWSPKVRRHVGGDGDRSDHRVHGESHGQGFGSDWPRERRLESLRGRWHGSVLRQRRVEKEGGGQIGGRQGLLNGANGLGFCWFRGSLHLRGDGWSVFIRTVNGWPKWSALLLLPKHFVGGLGSSSQRWSPTPQVLNLSWLGTFALVNRKWRKWGFKDCLSLSEPTPRWWQTCGPGTRLNY